MKIAYLSPAGALGGAELCLLDLLASARSLYPGWDLHVLLGGDGRLKSEVESLGIPCTVLPLPGNIARLGDSGLSGQSKWARMFRMGRGGLQALGDTLSYRRQLAGWLRALNPDVVQTNGMKMHLLGAWSARPGLPMVWHLHDYLGSRPAMARLLKLARRPGLTGVGVSESVAKDARSVLGSRVPVHTIYNRIDLDRFRPEASPRPILDTAAQVSPPPAGTVRVGLVATFAIWKGHRVFLEAISKIPRDRSARFYIIGGPIYQSAGSQLTIKAIQEQAEALGVSDRLVLTGHLDDPASAIQSLDVVVHASSRPEPFGRVIVEGMACGRAVVAIRGGGSGELFEEGRTALGCDPNHPDQLASAINRLILDPELRALLGREGLQSARERFDRTRLAEDWAPIYGWSENERSVRSPDRQGTETSGTRNYR